MTEGGNRGNHQPELAPQQDAMPLARPLAVSRVSEIMNALVEAMIERAVRARWHEDKLKGVYKDNKFTSGKADGLNFRPNFRSTYDQLFGFGKNGRLYMRRSEDRNAALRPIQLNHIKATYRTLELLGVHRETPPSDKEPTSWIPFLERALEAVNDTRGKAARDRVHEPVDAAVAAQLPGPNDPSAKRAASVGPVSLDDHKTSGSLSGSGWSRTRIGAIAALIAMLVYFGAVVWRLPSPPARPAKIEPAVAEVPEPDPNLKVRIGDIGTSGMDIQKQLPRPYSNQSSAQTQQDVDARVNEALRLRDEGNDIEADRLLQAVAEEAAQRKSESMRNMAEAHRQLGRAAFSRRNYTGAIAEWKIVIEQEGATPADFNDLGAAFHAKRDLAGALASYDEAIRRDREHAFAWSYNNRGNVYLDEVPPDPDRAIPNYEEALRIDPKLAQAHSNLGNALKLKGDLAGALNSYEAAIAIDPNFANPHNGRGNVFYDKGDMANAIASYTEALKIDPDDIPARVNRGYAELVAKNLTAALEDLDRAIGTIERRASGVDPKLAARAYMGRGSAHNMISTNPEAAIADFERAISLDKGAAFAYVGRATAHEALGAYQLALDDYQRAIDADRGPIAAYFRIVAYFKRGSFYLSRRAVDKSIADFDALVQLAPKEGYGYLGRGIVRAMRGEVEEGLKDFDEAARRLEEAVLLAMTEVCRCLARSDQDCALAALKPFFQPPESENRVLLLGVYQIRAAIYLAKGAGYVDLALADFDEAIKIRKTDPQLYLSRALAHLKKADPERAISDLNSAIELDHGNVRAYLARASLRQRAGNVAGTIADLEAVIALKPGPLDLATTYLYLGHIYFEQNEMERALESYRAAIGINVLPTSIDAHFRRAAIFNSQGDFSKQVEEYVRVIELKPDSPEVYRARARANRGAGNFSESLSDYSWLIAKNPRDSVAYDDRGDTYFAMGSLTAAIGDYDMAIAIDPKFSFAYIDRGKAHEAQGNDDAALVDFADALKADATNIRAGLRLFALRARTAPDLADAELWRHAKFLDQSDPLYPLIALFLGERSVESVPVGAGPDQCELNLWVGKWHELRGDKPRAIRSMKEAIATCSKEDMPYQGALLALKTLQQL